MSLNKLKVPSVREAFVAELEEKILSGELKVGDKLPPARELCAIMGVSLTVVNAGVAELVSKGFIEVKPRHGTYVGDYREKGTAEALLSIMRHSGGNLNAHEVRSFCESRVALDPFVAQLAIERASDEQLSELLPILERLEAADEVNDICERVTEFFHKMYRLSDNTIFSLLYNSTIEPQRGMYAIFIAKNGAEYIKSYTRELYSCLKARDIDGARRNLVEAAWLPLRGETSII